MSERNQHTIPCNDSINPCRLTQLPTTGRGGYIRKIRSRNEALERITSVLWKSRRTWQDQAECERSLADFADSHADRWMTRALTAERVIDDITETLDHWQKDYGSGSTKENVYGQQMVSIEFLVKEFRGIISRER